MPRIRVDILPLVLCFSLITVVAVSRVKAQQSTGTIKGSVKDPSGALIVDATVVAKAEATGVTTQTKTNNAGEYTFPPLLIGTYELRASAPGFKTMVVPHTRLISAQTVKADLKLELGEIADSVTVTAEAPVLDTASNETGVSRTTEEISSLPLMLAGNARSALGYVRTATGVNWTPTQAGGDPTQTSRSSIQGAPTATSGYYIDGISAEVSGHESAQEFNQPLPESVAEFKVSTNHAAEYGWNSGSGISLVLKSGTNEFHGSFFEYLRNEKLDARPWFASRRSVNKQNEYGFTIGGPIIKNRTFFFASYDAYRWRTAAAGTIYTVPTEKMRQGDFSELLGAQAGTDGLGRPVYQNQIYDPATTRSFGTGFIRDPFNYQGRLNVIDPARFSKVSQAFQKGYPLPNRPGTQNNLSWTPRAADYNSDILTGKIDHEIGSKHRLNFGFDHSLRNENINWNDRFLEIISPILTSTFPQYRYRFKYYWTPTNTVVFNFNAATTRVPNRYGGQRGYASENYGCEAGLKGYLVCNTPYAGIAQGITGFGYPHPGNFDAEQGTPIEANLAWTKGTHSLKFGVQHHTQIKRTVDRESSSASINFERQETGLPGFGTTGMGYASFLLGAVDNAQMRYPSEYKMVSGAWGFYAQDQWRLTPKFTLNYGLRWDVFTPHREADDEIGGFDPTIPNPAAGGRLGALTFWGSGSGRNGRRLLYDYYYKAVGPRIGFVYEIMPKTILRAYYGITYPPRFGQFTSGANAPRAGYSASLEPRSFDNGVTPAYYWDQPWPQTFPALPRIDPSLLNGTSIGYVDVKRAAEVAKFHNINVGLERELPGQIGIRANYVGLLSYNLPARALHPLNQLDAKYLSLGDLLLRSITSPEAVAAGIALPYPGFTGTVAQALRPYPQFQDIPDLGAPVGKNTYHSLQVSFDKRWGQGLTFVAGYTLSKTLNNGRYQNQGWLNSNYAQHYSILNTAYVLGELDRTHNLVVNYSYELPFGPGKRFGQNSSGPLRHFIGGWRVSASQFYMSGLPIDLSSDQRNPVSIGGGWVNRVPGVPIRTSFGRNLDPNDPNQRYLNVAAFQVPAAYTFGNTFRLPDVRQPPYFNENVAFAKRFRITEQMGLEFGANCFNLFNRHMLWNMQGNIQNPNFGRFSRASDPRTIQFYLRLTY